MFSSKNILFPRLGKLPVVQDKDELSRHAFVDATFNVPYTSAPSKALQRICDVLNVEPFRPPNAPGPKKTVRYPLHAVIRRTAPAEIPEPPIPGFQAGEKGKGEGERKKGKEEEEEEEEEKALYYALPRAFGLGVFPHATKRWHAQLLLRTPAALNLATFRGSLRKYQLPVVEHTLHHLLHSRTHSGLLCAGCGAGKTCMSLFLAAQLKVPLIITVHTQALMRQWGERCAQFLPDAKIGYLQGTKKPPADADVCVAMLHTLIKVQDRSLLDRYGFYVADECHHIAARTFATALQLLRAPYRLGLSATPERPDRLSHAIEWLLGPMLVMVRRTCTDVEVQSVAYNNPFYRHAKQRWRPDQMDYVASITRLVGDKARTTHLAELARACAKEGRDVLCISDRLDVLKNIHTLLPDISGLFVGSATTKAKKKKRQEALQKQIILASTNIAAEGLDCGRLNTLVLCTPKKAGPGLEQIVGRIQRGATDFVPLVVNFYDDYEAWRSMNHARRRWYLAQKFKLRKHAEIRRGEIVDYGELIRQPCEKKTKERKRKRTREREKGGLPKCQTTLDTLFKRQKCEPEMDPELASLLGL